MFFCASVGTAQTDFRSVAQADEVLAVFPDDHRGSAGENKGAGQSESHGGIDRSGHNGGHGGKDDVIRDQSDEDQHRCEEQRKGCDGQGGGSAHTR